MGAKSAQPVRARSKSSQLRNNNADFLIRKHYSTEKGERMYSGTATYNICDDKIRASFDERLSPEDYQAIKRAGFAYWRGSKLFVAKWSVYAEDKLREFGITEIEDDDQPDDVEARVDRFSGYAENAERSAESASNYAHGLVEGIPAGQPILVGHHSERGHRATLKRHDAAMRRALSESERAAYWNDRVANSIRHAKYKERPDVIARRIEGLEKDELKYTKELSDTRRLELKARAFVDARYKTNQESVELDETAFNESFDQSWQQHCADSMDHRAERRKRRQRQPIRSIQHLDGQSGGERAGNRLCRP